MAAIGRCQARAFAVPFALTLYNAWIFVITSSTEFAEIFVRVKISYSSVRELSYAIQFRTARVMSNALVYMYGFRMRLNFVLSAQSTKFMKLNRV